MDPTQSLITELIKQGALALVVAGLLLGWLVPKWVLDEHKLREKMKDDIIQRQSNLIEKMAAKAAALPPVQPRTTRSRTGDDDG